MNQGLDLGEKEKLAANSHAEEQQPLAKVVDAIDMEEFESWLSLNLKTFTFKFYKRAWCIFGNFVYWCIYRFHICQLY